MKKHEKEHEKKSMHTKESMKKEHHGMSKSGCKMGMKTKMGHKGK
jgi:hypothetical protein